MWVALGDLWSDHIVMCWGGFVHTGTYNLVFEYANRGNLADFFRLNNCPSNADELVQFWTNLINILHGLHRFHQHKTIGTGTLGGIHQDLHSQNILLSDIEASEPAISTPQPSARFAFAPKLADFGNSHVRVAPTETDVMDYPGQARYDHQTAAESPEQSDIHQPRNRDAPHFNGGPDTVTPRSDIWALGVVFSQAIIWSVLGAKGMREYADMCLQEGNQSDDGRGHNDVHFGSDGSFHDGVNALRAVKAMHRTAVAGKKDWDVLTSRIVEIVERHMLVRAPDRLSAKQLFAHFHRALPSEDGATVEATKTVTTTMSTSVNMDSAVLLDDVEKWRLARVRNVPPPNPTVDNTLWRMRRNLAGRRYVFLLDDSATMWSALGQVRQNLITLASVASHFSSRPSELVLASDPECTVRKLSQHEASVAKFVNALSFDNIPDLLESSLARLLDRVVVPHLRGSTLAKLMNRATQPIVIVLLTDGDWRGRGRGMEIPLRHLTQYLQKHDIDRSMAAVQLLQVAGSADARRNLEYLVQDVGGTDG